MNEIEKAIKYMKDRLRYALVATTIDVDYVKLAIKALEKTLTGGWIPVAERLPDNQQRVIVKCKGCPTVIGWIMHGRWHTDFGCMYKEYDVIAWQPLPEPYKEEEQ